MITIRYPYDIATLLGKKKEILRSGISASQPKVLAEQQARMRVRQLQEAAGECTESLSPEAPAAEVVRLALARKKLKANYRRTFQQALPYLEQAYSGIRVCDVRAALNKRALTKLQGIIRIGKGPKAGTPLANSTINTYMKVMEAAWNWAVDEEYIHQHRMESPGRLKGTKTKKRPFEYHEMLAGLAWFKHHPENAQRKRKRSLFKKHFPYFNLLSWLGCRAADCASLQWASIGDAFINVEGLVVHTVVYEEQKDQDKEEHRVDVPAEVIAALGAKGNPDQYVFPSRYGKTGHISITTMLEKLNLCLADLGLDASRYDQHSFRRSFVRDAGYGCTAAGLHPRDAALLSGHEVGYGMKIIGLYMQRAKARSELASSAFINYRRSLEAQYAEQFEATPETTPVTGNRPQNLLSESALCSANTLTSSILPRTQMVTAAWVPAASRTRKKPSQSGPDRARPATSLETTKAVLLEALKHPVLRDALLALADDSELQHWLASNVSPGR